MRMASLLLLMILSGGALSAGEKAWPTGMDAVRFIGFAPDGKSVLVCGEDNQRKNILRAFPTAGKNAGKPAEVPLSPAPGEMALADGKFYSCSASGYSVYSFPDGKLLEEVKSPAADKVIKWQLVGFQPAAGAAFFFDKEQMSYRAIELRNGKELFCVPSAGFPGYRVSGNGEWTVCAKSSMSEFSLIESKTGKTQTVMLAKSGVEGVIPSNDGSKLYYCNSPVSTGIVKIPFSLMAYDMAGGKSKPLLNIPDRIFVRRMLISGNERYLALAGDSSGMERAIKVYVLDLKGARVVKELVLPNTNAKQRQLPERMAFSADELKLAFDSPQEQGLYLLNLPK